MDVRKSSLSELQKVVGSYASFLFELAHGRDDREVDPSFDPKSCGTETTFEKDIRDSRKLLQTLEAGVGDPRVHVCPPCYAARSSDRSTRRPCGGCAGGYRRCDLMENDGKFSYNHPSWRTMSPRTFLQNLAGNTFGGSR